MDYFCEPCASNPGWPFDKEKAFHHSCQRCFQLTQVNDYAWKTGNKPKEAAPAPKDIVKENINPMAQANLPQAKAVPPTPQPVYPVAAPVSDQSKAMSVDELRDKLNGPEKRGITLTTKKA